MNFIKEQIEYLKDNPEGYWFKNKLYGWGWTPAKPAGWVTTIVFAAFVILVAFNIEERAEALEEIYKSMSAILLAFVLFITIIIRTGEPLKWRGGWGRKNNNESDKK